MNRVCLTHPHYQVIGKTQGAVTSALPNSTPITHAGIVEIAGERFDLSNVEGLVSYTAFKTEHEVGGVTYSPWFAQGHLVVINPASPDRLTLMASLCAMFQYGHEDRDLPMATAKAEMRRRRIRMQCGHSVQLVCSILDDLYIPWRRVHLLTADRPTNLDDGHVALEVYIDGGWRFIDISGGSCFTDHSGELLSTHQIVRQGVENCRQMRLAPTELSTGVPTPNVIVSPTQESMKFNSRPYMDIALGSNERYLEWARRVWQIPGIYDPTENKVFYYMPEGREDREDWLLSLSSAWRVIPEAEWLSRFPNT